MVEAVGADRRLVIVAGSGRSGTSSVAGVLNMLGLEIPGETLEGDRTNPRGFYEPEWLVEFQSRLLARAGVELTDARPTAFDLTHAVGAEPPVREELVESLRSRMDDSAELVVKDPRNSWFLPLWGEVARELGFAPAFLTMLRHPAEVIESKATYYGGRNKPNQRARGPQSTRAAAWLNVMLSGELQTRGSARTFVRYDELLSDWRAEMRRAGKDLGLTIGAGFSDEGQARVDEFIDPSLHRVRGDLGELDIPNQLKELCATVWDLSNELRDGARAEEDIRSDIDHVRSEYAELYADAEAIAHSSIAAARGTRGPKRRGKTPKESARGGGQAAKKAGPPEARRSLVGRIARRLRGA